MRDFLLWQLYTTVTGRYLNRNDIKELCKHYDRVLVPRCSGKRPSGVTGYKTSATGHPHDGCLPPGHGASHSGYVHQVHSSQGMRQQAKADDLFFTCSKKLLFCPILLFVGIALFSDAFDSEWLKGANSVLGTEVPRRHEAMLYSTLRDHMGDQSEDAGFEERWTPKFGRRGTANAANGIAPDSARD
ncbi:hypothetical protein EDB81DRAFT_850066 [Dactylonectria macrodidyma]|uniref:Uncharacterized protein n=1 Tax=Dactylonectria macrodidyma TaxID=307937 RepID=A0A9P9FSU6_9HYPO|nr:hypothetical protein EDB81DRAFT_850066 [Dactylonectria macrodidyma]